jgi:hypothetical protein
MQRLGPLIKGSTSGRTDFSRDGNLGAGSDFARPFRAPGWWKMLSLDDPYLSEAQEDDAPGEL